MTLCDVFGVHGAGIVGCIMTGICREITGGVGYAEGVTMVHCALAAAESIAITVVCGICRCGLHRLCWRLRTGRAGARRNVNSHGENAYNAYQHKTATRCRLPMGEHQAAHRDYALPSFTEATSTPSWV